MTGVIQAVCLKSAGAIVHHQLYDQMKNTNQKCHALVNQSNKAHASQKPGVRGVALFVQAHPILS